MTRTRKSGFTLVEILIVVIILGILAAIVIPQFTNASQDARESSLSGQLQTIRSQVELYKMQHGDTLPNLVAKWDQLTTQTKVDGTAGTDFGPYLQSDPKNSLVDAAVATKVVDGKDTTKTYAGAAFLYDYAAGAGTGKIWGLDKDGKVTSY